jgi:phenylpyruvate tautomerase
MPYLAVRTNQVVEPEKYTAILQKASRLVAETLGKPEEYVMVTLETSARILFAGQSEPAAFVEWRAIGLPTGRTDELARLLCAFLQSELDIPADRVFINFNDVPANLWGWNGGTF